MYCKRFFLSLFTPLPPMKWEETLDHVHVWRLSTWRCFETDSHPRGIFFSCPFLFSPYQIAMKFHLIWIIFTKLFLKCLETVISCYNLSLCLLKENSIQLRVVARPFYFITWLYRTVYDNIEFAYLFISSLSKVKVLTKASQMMWGL